MENLALRKDHVRKSFRDCPTHGNVEHAEYSVGYVGSTHWYCMECSRETKLQYYRDVRDGVRTPHENKRPEVNLGDVCKTCFMTKPLTGVCDNCD